MAYLKWLNKLVFALGFVLAAFLGESHAQERFNLRQDFGMVAVNHFGLEETESGYRLSSATLLETDSGTIATVAHVHLNFDGGLSEINHIAGDPFPFLLNPHVSGTNFNSDLPFSVPGSGFRFDPEVEAYVDTGFLLNFNNNGDTTSVNYFYSPYHEADPFGLMAPTAACPSTNPDNSIFIASNIGVGSNGDFYIQRMRPDGEVLWEWIWATSSVSESCKVLLPTEDGGVCGLGRRSADPEFIFRLDSLGNLVYQNNLPIPAPLNDAVWSEANTFIGVGGGTGTDSHLTGKVFKMDMSGDTLWHRTIGLGVATNPDFQNQFTNVVHSTDGEGYVAGGRRVDFVENPTDTSGTTQTQGWLVKVDEDGNVLWDRRYHFLNTPDEEHTLNDLKACSDGGYIFCGESTDNDWQSNYQYSEGPRQQGWLVKVDEHGCLVEDCHLSTNEVEGLEMEYFLAGPNPASHFLNIFDKGIAQGGNYQLHNFQGQLLDSFPASSFETTAMLAIDSYARGTYVLTLARDGQVLQSEKVVFK